jgi:hypothetical protein
MDDFVNPPADASGQQSFAGGSGGGAPQPGMGGSEATRYLCAAAHLRCDFREWIRSNLLLEQHRAIAPSFGVDVRKVVSHSLWARRRARIRDLALTLVLLLGFLQFWRGGSPWALLLAWPVVLIYLVSTHAIVTLQLSRSGFPAAPMPKSIPRRWSARLDRLDSEQTANVVVFSGYGPFVGSGASVGGWSLAVDVRRPPQDRPQADPQPFPTAELYDHVTERLNRLNLPGLTVQERLYVNGTQIGNDPRFLPDPFKPPKTVGQLVRGFIDDPSGHARHYQCVQIASWKDELILSIFLRYFQAGGNLYVAADHVLLAPIRQSLRHVDHMQPVWRPQMLARLLGRALLTTPIVCVRAPTCLFQELRDVLGRSRHDMRARRSIKDNPMFDYGARVSLRELASHQSYRQYFQFLDKDMYVKVVEKNVLDGILAFLEEKNVDTTDLVKRQLAKILEQGVVSARTPFRDGNAALGHAGQTLVASRRHGEGGPRSATRKAGTSRFEW